MFLCLFLFFCFLFVSPEFSYRPGLGVVAEGSPSGSSPSATGSGGPPNRPLPPTPDDDESQGDKTLVLRNRVRNHYAFICYNTGMRLTRWRPTFIFYVLFIFFRYSVNCALSSSWQLVKRKRKTLTKRRYLRIGISHAFSHPNSKDLLRLPPRARPRRAIRKAPLVAKSRRCTGATKAIVISARLPAAFGVKTPTCCRSARGTRPYFLIETRVP